jgi:hypothetical protein
MENQMEYLSLYDFLGKAAGMELGAAVCKSAIESKEKIGEREIENPKYKGKVHLYRKEFLDKYFNVNQSDDLPF